MIIPDINLLIYAHDSASPFHPKAVAWWQECLSGTEPVGLPPVVIFGFVRIATNARAFHHPMAIAEAAGHVRAWLAQACVEVLESSPNQIEEVLKLLAGVGTAGNLVTDAQIAFAALERDATLHTTDADFIRFPGLRWFNPLTGTGSHLVRKPRK